MRRITEQRAPWSMLATGAIVLIFALLTATPVLAQVIEMGDIRVEMLDMEQDLNEVAQEVQAALNEISAEKGLVINIDNDDEDSRPKLGVYLSNMDFEDAYKMRYPYAHGVLVNGTVNNGNADKAGIIEDDIIMYFGGTKVLYEDHLVRLIRSKHFGDTVKLVFWRDEAKDSTTITFTAPVNKKKSDKQLEMVKEGKDEKKRKHSRGFGGGGFTPMLVQNDFTDVVGLMNGLGLTSTPFNAEGIVLFGGSGQGYVGNGWYLGGFGNGGGLSNTVQATHSVTGATVDRKISFAMGFGGMTIEKRFAPFSFATIGGGVGLGAGSIQLNVTQNDGAFDWNKLNDELIDTKTTSVTFSKNYATVHPRANVMIRLTSWMRLKAEYGYLYGYSFTDGWKTTLDGNSIDNASETFVLNNSPDTALDASTISLGLWFGF